MQLKSGDGAEARTPAWPARARSAAWTTLLTASCLLGCGGGGRHGGTPTVPHEPLIQAAITASIVSSSQSSTLQEAELLFDGVLVSDQVAASPAPLLALNGVGILAPARLAMTCDANSPVDLGPHTLDIIVLRQTSSPSPYTVPLIQLHVSGDGTEDVTLHGFQGNVTTGQDLHWDFCL